MNAVEKALVNYTYDNQDINKWVTIFKRTKKNRIKNKQFVKILVAAIKERKVIRCDEVVLVDMPMAETLLGNQDVKRALDTQTRVKEARAEYSLELIVDAVRFTNRVISYCEEKGLAFEEGEGSDLLFLPIETEEKKNQGVLLRLPEFEEVEENELFAVYAIGNHEEGFESVRNISLTLEDFFDAVKESGVTLQTKKSLS